jgi:hypothetical protein
LVLLLLFGLGSDSGLRRVYQKSVSRIFSERATELKNCSLAVKVHPGADGTQERAFIDWLKGNIPAQVYPIIHSLNLEFMLPQLRPDYVWAGPCGAMPIVRRLKVARPIVLPEITEELCRRAPADGNSYLDVVQGIEAW